MQASTKRRIGSPRNAGMGPPSWGWCSPCCPKVSHGAMALIGPDGALPALYPFHDQHPVLEDGRGRGLPGAFIIALHPWQRILPLVCWIEEKRFVVYPLFQMFDAW